MYFSKLHARDLCWVWRVDIKWRQLCNRFKGSDIASVDGETGEITPLFHPRLNKWKDHHEIRDGAIVALTARGRVTVKLLRMNPRTEFESANSSGTDGLPAQITARIRPRV